MLTLIGGPTKTRKYLTLLQVMELKKACMFILCGGEEMDGEIKVRHLLPF